MNHRFLYFVLLSLSLSACSTGDPKRAAGDFDYANTPEPKPLVIPDNLDKPAQKREFSVNNNINHNGPVGEKMDIRAPSLVLPVASGSRVESDSGKAIIWFDKVLEEEDLLAFIENSIMNQFMSDDVGYEVTKREDLSSPSESKKDNGNLSHAKTVVYESDWYNEDVESGWLFTSIESSTSLKFRFTLNVKPHGRSVSLEVDLVRYLKTDQFGGSNKMDPIDQHRIEMAMVNEIISQVDYDYRLKQQENRLLRAQEKLVSIGENASSEPAYIVELDLDNLWDNMPVFFEQHGFTVTDLNETDKIYYVDFVKPDNSIWASIWGDDVPVIDVNDEHYQFVLSPADEKGLTTIVTIYNSTGSPLTLETLENIFPVMEKGLSFRNVY
ncbi:MAG: outer membrane protein assembly factor BamC [Colwellia sp.]